jgi:ABC-2 type transport system permease protein
MLPEVLRANVRKVGIEMIRYLPNTISLVLTFYLIFLVMFFGIQVVGDPGSADENIRFLIVSNAFWFLLLLGISSMGWEITTEATRGTLEQLYMAPVGAWRILLARMIGTVGINLLIMIAMIFLSMLTAGKWLNLAPLPLLLIIVPTLVSIIGLGFIAGGLAIVFKQVQALLQVMQFLFLGLAFVPLESAPWLEFAPVVKGIDLMRNVMVSDLTLAQISTADWLSLLLNAVFYFGLGLAVFLFCEKRALDRGLLGQY